jgi:DNA-directed RNA polymerase sigma subunit (sigma70/sigma32)
VRPPKENLDITMIDNIKTEFRMTQDEVAQSFGVTRNNIQQIEKRAMEKVRAELKKRGIEKEDYLGGD